MYIGTLCEAGKLVDFDVMLSFIFFFSPLSERGSGQDAKAFVICFIDVLNKNIF